MKSVNSRQDLSVVRIYKQQEVVGAGFLVSDEYILTCAHVVATALGIDSDSPQKPTQEVEIDFLNIQLVEPLTAKVEFWLPVNPVNSPEDIAVLKLNKSLPMPAQIASLSMTKCDLYDRKFEACGFPEGMSRGVWAEGVIKRYVDGNWIQLVGDQNTGYRLEEGFSGTPIWVKDLGVVGIAVAADKLRPEVKAAFMIPTELLFQAWDRLLEVCSFDSRISSLISLLEPDFEAFKNHIEIAYQKSLPQVSIGNFPNSITEIVRSLDAREDNSKDDYSCLEKFVGYLLLSLEDSELKVELCQSLKNWLDNYSRNYQDLLNLLKQKQETEQISSKSKEPCLLLAVFNDNNSYTVQGWLIENIKSYNPLEGAGCYPLTNESNKITTDPKLSNLRETINLFIGECISHSLQSIQKIQFFLPPELILNNLEVLYSLILHPERYYKQTINAEYEMSIRLAPRLRGAGKDLIVKWFSKGRFLSRQQKRPAVNVLKNQNCSVPKELFNELNSSEIVAVRLNKVIQKSKLEWVIAAFLQTGIPLALWMRKEIEGRNCCQDLEEICQKSVLEQLSEEIKNKSNKTPDTGSCLSLLWDDPTLVPPEYAPEHILKMS